MIYPVHIYCKPYLLNCASKIRIFDYFSLYRPNRNFSKVVITFLFPRPHRMATGLFPLFPTFSPANPQVFPRFLWKTVDFSEDLSTTIVDNRRFLCHGAGEGFSTDFTRAVLTMIRYRTKIKLSEIG